MMGNLGHFLNSLGPSIEGEPVDSMVGGVSFDGIMYDV